MKGDYGYSNARLRAMKGRLLDKAFFERLLSAKQISETVPLLERTDYRPHIHESLLKIKGAAGIEEGLRRNMVATSQKILSFVDGEVRMLVKILLGRWDVQNIKTILRGKHAGASDDEIRSSLIPAGELNESTLQEIVRQPDVKSCIDLLATWEIIYARPLTEGFLTYVESEDLQSLELALDKFYYADALAKLHGHSLNTALVREVIKREIDVTNIMSLIRLTWSGIPADEGIRFFIPGGKALGKADFQELLSAGAPEQIMKALKTGPYGEALAKGEEDYRHTAAVSAIERRLEEFTVRQSIKLFRGDPLTIAVVIAFLAAKLNEIVNLRIVVRGKEANLPEGQIRRALVLV